MSYFDRYKRRVALYGSTTREQIINEQRYILESNFSDHPSYQEVYLNGSETPIGIWIIENSTTKDTQEFISVHDVPINAGDILLWNDWHWLVTYKDAKIEIYHQGTISKCIAELKWLDEKGTIQSTYFSYRNEDLTNFGIDGGRIITLGNERRHVYIPSNEHTRKLRKNKRFIVDDRAWKVISVDRLKQGLIYLVLQEDEINTGKDNLDLQIADYYGNVVDGQHDDNIQDDDQQDSNEYKIEIIGSDEIKYGQSRTYQVVILNNGEEIYGPVLFELFAEDQVSQTTIAKISSQEETKCTIKNNNVSAGTIQLKVTHIDSGTFVWKRIEMKPLF